VGRMGSEFKKLYLVVLLAAFAIVLSGASRDTLVDEMTTPERIDKHPWWPTKLSTPADKFTGSAACAECHADISRSQQQSEMAQSLMPADKSEYLKNVYGKQLSVDGFTYDIQQTENGASFILKTDAGSVSKPLVWAFGSGKISQVYMTPEADFYNESHFSYFDSIHGFDSTPAQPVLRVSGQDEPQDSLKKAVGRQVQMHEVRRCFACHAANVPAAGPINDIIPGSTCETCHGPGANHVAAMRANLPNLGYLIMNPAHLRPVDQVDFCGSCHATSMDVQMAGSFGLPSVRFPAYRLQNSACWRDDARIQCTACHDPHKPLLRETAGYDQRCLACHVSGSGAKPDGTHPGKACPVQTKDCASCHMPKYEFPDVHHKFTDHQIRVVRQGETIPG
jgi:Cytochrome c554 and c-prime